VPAPPLTQTERLKRLKQLKHLSALQVFGFGFIKTIDTRFRSLGYSSKQRVALCESGKLPSLPELQARTHY
jgi:hypothetical protein